MKIKLANVKLQELQSVLDESTDLSLIKLFPKTKFKGWGILSYRKKQVLFQHSENHFFHAKVDKTDSKTKYIITMQYPNNRINKTYTKEQIKSELPTINRKIKRMINEAK